MNFSLPSTWQQWAKGAVAAAVNGAATSIAAVAFGANWNIAWKVAGFSALQGAANYFKQSPLPTSTVTVTATQTATLETKKD